MRNSKVLLALLLLLPFAAASANAQVSWGVSVGVGPAVVSPGYYYDGGYYGPPVCEWGYYPWYPYTCAPYGYYGPQWFYSGIFIGAGPWYGWGWRGGYLYRFDHHRWYRSNWDHDRFRGAWGGRGWDHDRGRDHDRGWDRDRGHDFRGGYGNRGGYGDRGGNGFRGGDHGGNAFRGGNGGR